MSMYTELLTAAFGQCPGDGSGVNEQDAIDEVMRCRAQREEGVPPTADADMVPTVLALEIAYDVALLQLARVSGVETDPGRFEQPRLERERVEHALRERGISLERASDSNDEQCPITS